METLTKNTLEKAIYLVASGSDKIIFDVINEKKDKNLLEAFQTVKATYESVFKTTFPEFKKEEDRSSTGAYYTPEFIVEYMVKETVGKKEFESLEELLEFKTLDPAMGGAIFLLKVHDYLTLKAKQFCEDDINLYDIARATASCLHGRDINPDAIELAKCLLNLNVYKWSLNENT